MNYQYPGRIHGVKGNLDAYRNNWDAVFRSGKEDGAEVCRVSPVAGRLQASPLPRCIVFACPACGTEFCPNCGEELFVEDHETGQCFECGEDLPTWGDE